MVREPGLRALNQSKRTRHRQMVTGRAAIGGGLPPKLFVAGFLGLVIAGIFYYRADASKVEEQRGALLAQQRAMEATLGPKLRPLQGSIEKAALELAQEPFAGDLVELSESPERLWTSPGVYLRLRLEDARSEESMRKAARSALRDAFSACLFRDPKGLPFGEGKPCKESLDCDAGELCTEFAVCQRPSTPFNMKLVHRAASVLESTWVEQVREARTDLGLLALERMLESVTRVDVPLAIEVLQRAQFVVVLLDEPASGDVLPERGAEESDADYAQRIPHAARAGIWSFKDEKWLARLRLEARGELREVSATKADFGPESERTRQRQAQGCAFALEFQNRLQKGAASKEGSGGEPAAAP